MVNDAGGVNGRKIDFITLDDGYSPPKTVEQTRQLVEQDQVFGIFGSLGTPTNASVQRYLNERKVPQMFLFTGTSRFRDPQHYPWTMGSDLSFVSETRGFAKFILKEKPDAKIAVLYQNDDYGKDHLNTLKAALGDKAKTMVVAEASYEVTDPTVDLQVVGLKASGADTLARRCVAQIRRAGDPQTRRDRLASAAHRAVPGLVDPAGHAAGRSRPFGRRRHCRVPEGAGRPGLAERPGGPRLSRFHEELQSWCRPERLVERHRLLHGVRGRRGPEELRPELTRERLLDRVSHMEEVAVPMLIPGITLNTTPTDYHAIKQMRLKRFDGARWVPLGGIISE